MKSLFKLLLTIFIASVITNINAQTDTISTFPYYQNFEGDTTGWYFTPSSGTYGTVRWSVGTAANYLPGTYPSGMKGLNCSDGAFSFGSKAYSPVFNIYNLTSLLLQFEACVINGHWNSPIELDLEYSMDGVQWNQINTNNYSMMPWTEVEINLDSLVGNNQIQFRFIDLHQNRQYIDNHY